MEPRVVLSGSERLPIPGGEPVSGENAVPSPDKQISVTVVVQRKAQIPTEVVHAGTLDPEQLAADHGASATDLMAVQRFAERYNLSYREEHSALKRTVVLSGSIASMEAAFGTTLRHVSLDGTVYRERTGPLTLPEDVAPVIDDVLGLDDRPVATPHFRPSLQATAALTPLDIARLYNFPAGTGSGQVIAIIELGGGFIQADLDTYFSSLGVPSPKVTAISVQGVNNSPSGNGPKSADPEVLLDIEVGGGRPPPPPVKVFF